MTDQKFSQYIKKCIVSLYPDIAKEWDIDEQGNVIAGPILIKTDAGPGRLCANFSNVDFRKQLNDMGCHIILSLPNATSVSAELDDIYRDYKASCRARTQKLYSDKVYRRMLKIRENNARAQNDPHEVVKPVGLNQGDIPTIVMGTEGDAIVDRPFLHTFTKDRMQKAWDNIGFVPFTRKCLSNKKVRR